MPPSHAELLALGASDDIKRMDAHAVQALIPAMAQAQKELQSQLQGWLQKLGPQAIDEKFTAVQLKQAQVLLGIAQATAGNMQKYPHASLPWICSKAVQDVMGQAQAPKLAMQTITNALHTVQMKFTGMPGLQLKHAGFLAKGDKLVLSKYATSAARYAGQVKDDLKFQFGVGLAKGETLGQLVKRIANLGSFRQAVDASHPGHAAGAMASSLTGRYHNWGRRLVVTELANAYNYSAKQSILEAHKIDHRVRMVWDAANDMRVCLECRSLHGTIIDPIDGFFKKGLDQPPAHPFCRCALVPWWDEMGEDAGDVDMPPSAEEVEAVAAAKAAQELVDEKAAQQAADELAAKEQAERVRQRAESHAAKQAAAEDQAAYQAALDQIAKVKADAEAMALKAAEEAAAAQAVLDAFAKQAESDAAALLAEQQAAEKAAKQAKKDVAKAKKLAKLEAAAPVFNPLTSPDVSLTLYKRKHKGKGAAFFTEKGLHKIDANTYVGHGYKYEWESGKGWMTTHSPKLEGWTYHHGFITGVTQPGWLKAGQSPASLAPPKPTSPVTPMPAPIKGWEWKAVGPEWVLHKEGTGVAAKTLVPAYEGPMTGLPKQYSLGQQLAQQGFVPTGAGVMEGYGYKYVKDASGTWQMISTPEGPVAASVPKPSPPVSTVKPGAQVSSHGGKQLTDHEFQARRRAYATKIDSEERAAMLSYSGSSYTSINSALRRHDVASTRWGEAIKHIDRGIDKAVLDEAITVHRGVNGHNMISMLGGLKPGEVFVEHGYTSTSALKGNAFSGEIELIITVPAGHKAAPIPSHHDHEREFLLPRGTHYKVVRNEYHGGKRQMELLVINP